MNWGFQKMSGATVFQAFLSLHIALGFINLCSFWLAVISINRTYHRLFGRIYFYSTLSNSITSLLLSALVINYPNEIYPTIAQVASFRRSLLLIYSALIPIVASITSLNMIRSLKSKFNYQFHDKMFVVFVICGLLLCFAGFKFDIVMTAINGFVPCLLITYFYFIFRTKYFENLTTDIKKMYHARFFIISGTALHAAFFSGGASVRYFGNTYEGVFLGARFYVPITIGILAEQAVVFYFKNKIKRQLAEKAPLV